MIPHVEVRKYNGDASRQCRNLIAFSYPHSGAGSVAKSFALSAIDR